MAVELWPVRYVNDPRIIGQEQGFVSVNATLEVDLLGQCASESIGSRLFSGSGGQADSPPTTWRPRLPDSASPRGDAPGG